MGFLEKTKNWFAPTEKVRVRDVVREGANLLTSNTQRFGQYIGESLALPGQQRDLDQQTQTALRLQSKVFEQMRKNRAAGKDNGKLIQVLKNLNGQVQSIEQLNPTINATNKEVLGAALGTIPEVLVGGIAPSKTATMAAKASQAGLLSKVPTTGTILKTAGKEVLKAAPFGLAYDISENLNQNKSGRELLTPGMGTALSVGLPALGAAASLSRRSFLKTAVELENFGLPAKEARRVAVQPINMSPRLRELGNHINFLNTQYANSPNKMLEKRNLKALKQAQEYFRQEYKAEMQGGYLRLRQEKTLSPSEKYVEELVAKQEAARKGEKPGVLSRFYRDVKRKLIDFNAPIEDTLRQASKEGKYQVLPKYDITNQIDRSLRADSIAGQFLRDNKFDTVIRDVDNLANLDQYMIAKQAAKVEQQGIKTGRDLAKDAQLIGDFKERYEPFAKQVTGYSQKLLDYAVETGLVDKDLAQELKTLYPDYVPLKRIFDEELTSLKTTAGGNASLSRQTVLQRLKGSEREVDSPIESLLKRTREVFEQGEKNKAAQILTGYVDLPNNPFQLRKLAPGEAQTGKATISVFRNGVKEVFETTPDIARAAKALNVQQLGLLGKVFAMPVRLAKLGITGINLPFVGGNLARDPVLGFINSSRGWRTSVANPKVFLQSLWTTIGHGKQYEEMVRQGTAFTSFDLARNQPVDTIASIRAGRSLGSRVAYTVRHPSEILRVAENIIGRSEELTRAQQYIGTKQALLAEGRPLEDAIIEASKQSRSATANFSRRGEWGTVLNSAVLYLNAGIQGSRSFVQAMKTRPVATSVKLATSVLTPMAIMTTWNLSDPKRKAAYDDIADYEKATNFIIVPPNPTQDDRGRWNVIKIPLSPGLASAANIVRQGILDMKGYDETSFKSLVNNLIGTVSPVQPNKESLTSTLVPQITKPTVETATNTNLFTGLPIVPERLQGLSPELQKQPWTSATATKLAGLTGSAPLKTEAFIKSTFGGVGLQALNLSDRTMAALGVIKPQEVGGQDLLDAVTSRFSKAQGGQGNKVANTKLKELLTQQADQRFLDKQEAEVIYDQWSRLPAEEANSKAQELAKSDPELYAQLKNVVQEEKAGLTYTDRLIRQLGVENGARAKFIWQSALDLPEDQRNPYIEQLQAKQLISKKVWQQLKALQAQAATTN